MVSPLINRLVIEEPFSLDPGEKAAGALSTAMTAYQVAWPFEPLVAPFDAFVKRWVSLFADAVAGELARPRYMPEREPSSSWRSR